MVDDCVAGRASMDRTITPDASTGAFIFKNAASERCLDEPNFNTANGVQLDIWDCNGGTNHKFTMQALPPS